MKLGQGGVWERSHHWPSHSSYPEQTAFAFSIVFGAGLCPAVGRVATHSNVYDSPPERGQIPPLHHILVVAAVVRRVGLPAVLEVVGQHVVPVALLL